jgi:hypothetical protein
MVAVSPDAFCHGVFLTVSVATPSFAGNHVEVVFPRISGGIPLVLRRHTPGCWRLDLFRVQDQAPIAALADQAGRRDHAKGFEELPVNRASRTS